MMLGVRLTVVPTQGETDVICSMLRVEGIKCADRLADSIETSGNRWEILVAESDLAAARELLAPSTCSIRRARPFSAWARFPHDKPIRRSLHSGASSRRL